MKQMIRLLPLAMGLLCVSCASKVQTSPQKPVANKVVTSGISKYENTKFKVLSEVSLDADGKNTGLSAYDLIRNFGGKRSIESPDLYSENHPGVPHILEDTDDIVGNHFVFLAHRDIDRDRNKLQIIDRQRNEIKAYDKSKNEVLGFKNETLVYQWKFKINDNMEVSKRFSHFFQLKAKGGNDKSPIVTITGNERKGEDGIEVRHKGGEKKFTVLQRTDWAALTGEWVEVYCRVTYAESGSIRLIAKRMSDGKTIFDIDKSELDLWRGTDSKHMVRPKWGIYRSIADYDNLRSDEEVVRFANFKVNKVLSIK